MKCLSPGGFSVLIKLAGRGTWGESLNIFLTHDSSDTPKSLGTWVAINVQGKGNEIFFEFCGKMNGLAFLLIINNVKKGMTYLRTIISSDTERLLDYFDKIYVNSINQRIQCKFNTCGGAAF